MPRLSLDIALAIGGIVLTVVLLVLDKAEKLNGPALYWLLALAAFMTLPLALGNPVIAEASGAWKYWAHTLALVVVVLVYWAIGIWISPTQRSAANSRISAKPPEQQPNTGSHGTVDNAEGKVQRHGTEDTATATVGQTSSPKLRAADDPRAENIQNAVKARDAAQERLNRIRERQHEPPVTVNDQGNQVAKKEFTLIVYPHSVSLKEKSLFLSFLINSYVVERLENGPPYVKDAKDTPVLRAYEAETQDKYRQSYGSQVKNVHDRLKQEGLQDPALDELYLNPATLHGIRVVADRLQELADKMPDEPDSGP